MAQDRSATAQFVAGLRAFPALARLENALLPAIALIAGWVAAGHNDNDSLFLRIVLLVLLHSVVTVWNDIADEVGDAQNGIHRMTALRRAGGYKVLITGVILITILCIVMSWWLPLDCQLLVGGYLVLGWLYNAPPLRASRRPILSMAVLGLAYGAAPFLLGSGLRGLAPWVWLLCAGWTLVRLSLSFLKDYKDAPGDAKAGKRTFLLVYGNRRTVQLSLALAATGYTICTAVVAWASRFIVPAGVSLCLVAGWLFYQRLGLRGEQTYGGLNRLFHQFLWYEILFDCLAVAWLRTH